MYPIWFVSGMQICDPIEEMVPFDYDLSALLESFPNGGSY